MSKKSTQKSKRSAALFAGVVLLLGACSSEDETANAVKSEDSETVSSNVKNVDVGLFSDGALDGEAEEVDCNLSDGSESRCISLTVVGDPVDRTDGPYCPPSTSSTAEEGGTWFDGENFYEVDGEFILDLPEIYGDEKWVMYDEDGNVNILDPDQFLNADGADPGDANVGMCVMASISDLPDGAVAQSVTIPKVPTFAASPLDTGRGGIGVTLDGVKIEGPAPIELILSTFSLGVFDDCGGHVNPAEGYHIHGAVECAGVEVDNHSKMFGYALDGFVIYYHSEDKDLDDCGGHESEELGYHYHANKPEVNSVLSCLSGLTVEGEAGGGPGGGGPGGPPRGGAPPAE